VGFADLLLKATKVLEVLGWPAALGALRTSDVQLLLPFAVRALSSGLSTTEDVVTELKRYASLGTPFAGVAEQVAPTVAKLIEALRIEFEGDPVGRSLTMATGLPPDYLRHVVREVRAFSAQNMPTAAEWIAWSDVVVRSGMEQAANSAWYGSVFGALTPDALFAVTSAWRSGRPVGEIEAIWSGAAASVADPEDASDEEEGPEMPGSAGRGVRMRVGTLLSPALLHQ
jgi:hypothetical protein